MSATPLPAQPLPSEFTAEDWLVWELLLKGRPPDPFTQADLDALPEGSGYRFELLDGILIVSPSPTLAHQRLAADLFVLLRGACPANCDVLFGPFDLKPSEERTFLPDVLVARTVDFDEKMLTRAPPLLVVEVRSPSTGCYDRTTKRAVYAEWGVRASFEPASRWTWKCRTRLPCPCPKHPLKTADREPPERN